MFRLIAMLLGALTSGRDTGPSYLAPAAGPGYQPRYRLAGDDVPADGWSAPREDGRDDWPGPRSEPGWDRGQGRGHRVRRYVIWSAVVVLAGLIFRRAIAAITVTALSAALHLVGVNVHLPHIRFAWPWQTVTAGTTQVDVGPWVLQRIEGISHPALGQASFSFLFTRKVSKSVGPFPCWYASTFYAVGRASATVDLNPGPAWWRSGSGHYQLRVLSQPASGLPGRVAVTMVLPRPQLPQSVHDVSVDDTASHPVSVQHSWTYPGFGCGVLVRPQFTQAALFAEAQRLAFRRSRTLPSVTRPLIRAAETEAAKTIKGSFVEPTVNRLGYTLSSFSLRWSAEPGAAEHGTGEHGTGEPGASRGGGG